MASVRSFQLSVFRFDSFHTRSLDTLFSVTGSHLT